MDRLVPHERCDGLRSDLLEKRLTAEGVLRNPPVVAPLQDELDHYVVLDGANRKNALQTMGVPHILAQVVSPCNPGLNLRTWNQVVLRINPEELITRISDLQDLEIEWNNKSGHMSENLEDGAILQVHLPSGEVYTASSHDSNLLQRVKFLNIIMTRIGEHTRLERTHLQSIDILKSLHPGLAGLIKFPCFKVEEIIQLASAKEMIPAGITRIIISPRALRVNYKISELRADMSLDEKDRDLNNWIQERVLQKGVRSYDETTVMFDE